MNIITVLCILNLVLASSASSDTSQHLVSTDFNCVLDLLNPTLDVSVVIAHAEADIDELLNKLQVQYFIFNVRNIATTPLDMYLNVNMYDIHLLIIQNIEELNEILQKLKLNVRARYLVLNFGEIDSEAIFQIVWAKYIINVDVLWAANGTTYIDTFFPYQNKDCRNNTTVLNLGQCPDLTLDAIFPNKVPLDLHGCEINVGVSVLPPFVLDPFLQAEDSRITGIEAMVFRNVLRKMNLIQNITSLSLVELPATSRNGQLLGTYQHLAAGDCDLVYGGRWNKFELAQVFDSTYTHYIDAFVWHVPVARPGVQWINIFLTFKCDLWMYLFIGVLLMMLAVWIFGRLCAPEWNYRSFSWSSLNMFRMLLTGTISLPQSNSLRVLILFWNIFAVILTTSYQSQLLSFLMKPVFEKQISNVDELLKSSLEIRIGPALEAMLKHSPVPSDKEIYKKGTKYDLKQMQRPMKHNVAFVSSVCVSKYVMMKLLTSPDGKPQVYRFKQPFQDFILTMHTVRGFPLLDRMNDIILRSIAAGFHAKWLNDIQRPTIEEQTELRTLRTDDLTGVYIILATGYFCAVLALLAECIIYKIFRNKNK